MDPNDPKTIATVKAARWLMEEQDRANNQMLKEEFPPDRPRSVINNRRARRAQKALARRK